MYEAFIVIHCNEFLLGKSRLKEVLWHVCRDKRKSAFGFVRIHITLHMRKVWSGYLLFIETFYSIQWLSSWVLIFMGLDL